MAMDRLTQQILGQHQATLSDMADGLDANTNAINAQTQAIKTLTEAAKHTRTAMVIDAFRALSAPVQMVVVAAISAFCIAALFLLALLYSGASPEAFALRFLDRAAESIGAISCESTPQPPSELPHHALPAPHGETLDDASSSDNPTQ